MHDTWCYGQGRNHCIDDTLFYATYRESRSVGHGIDGLFGIPTAASEEPNMLVITANAGYIDEAMISFNPSEMKATLGAYDTHKVLGGVTGMVWSDLAHPMHWSVLISSLSVDETQLYTNKDKIAHVHPGTAAVGLFSNDFAQIKDLVSDHFKCDTRCVSRKECDEIDLPFSELNFTLQGQ